MHVLFVCTGNICRSPIAERLAVLLAEQMQVPDFTASSAGTRALVGHPIHPDSVRVIESRGGDASNFSARRLSKSIASHADLILTMTRAHCDIALETAPGQLRRTFTLAQAARIVTEFAPASVADLAVLRPHIAADEACDIRDPIGRSSEFFADVGAEIADLLPPILELCGRSTA
ncbi:low molecular weight phosphatase family protein [Mycolicibacterium sp. CH28]|uniref:arsenate reductase/protein-tyrosine-phosphatase family protein n=1 Tax=Mycolicibacterium sp. CH28 TaxID=2512237 RepID=UPI001082074E|nr:low molecular weight phosphatase family protein [Mycolicibacterium sp. CH28]TGD83791.1 low molecular weight phosphatase family protein [Mycolicibacterium sp. CH28]